MININIFKQVQINHTCVLKNYGFKFILNKKFKNKNNIYVVTTPTNLVLYRVARKVQFLLEGRLYPNS